MSGENLNAYLNIRGYFFPLSIPQIQNPLVCTMVGIVWPETRTRNVTQDKKWCEGVQNGREGWLWQQFISKAQKVFPSEKMPVPLEVRNYKECQLLSGMFLLVIGEKKQAGSRLPAHASAWGGPTVHTDTCKKIDLQAEKILDTESSWCLPGVLRGSSISFHSNALFVDKSKLMIVKREAFGGKILLTLLRLNLTTEQDTSSCRNDRLL